MVAKRLDELARITGPGAIAGLVVTALGSDDSYYLCWKTKAGTYKQDSRNLPPLLEKWLFPPDGSTRDLASLQVVLGRDGGFVASDCDGRIEGKAEPRRLERASTLPLSQSAMERQRRGIPLPSVDLARASSVRLTRERSSTVPFPKLATGSGGNGSAAIENQDGTRDALGGLWMMKGLGGTMSTRASTVATPKAPLFERSGSTDLNSSLSPGGGPQVATTVPLPWDMPLQRRRDSLVVMRDQAAAESPTSPASTRSAIHQRKRSLASSTMFTSSAHVGRMPRLQSPTKALPYVADNNPRLRQPRSSSFLESQSEAKSPSTGSLPPWEKTQQQRASPVVASPVGEQPSQVRLNKSRPILPPIDTTVSSSHFTPSLPESPASPARPPTPVVPTRREIKRRPRRTMTGPEVPAPLRLLGRPAATNTNPQPTLAKLEGGVPAPAPVVRSILKPTSPSSTTQSPSLTRVPLNFARRSRGAGGSLDITRIRASIVNSVNRVAVDRGTSPTDPRQVAQQWSRIDAGYGAGGKCFCNCHDGSFVVDAGVQTDLPSPKPHLSPPRPSPSPKHAYSDAGIQTDPSLSRRPQGPGNYGIGPPKRSQVHWADLDVGSESGDMADSSGGDSDASDMYDGGERQPGYMGRMTDYFRSPQYSLGDALG